jgi:hypothetical protein
VNLATMTGRRPLPRREEDRPAVTIIHLVPPNVHHHQEPRMIVVRVQMQQLPEALLCNDNNANT